MTGLLACILLTLWAGATAAAALILSVGWWELAFRLMLVIPFAQLGDRLRKRFTACKVSKPEPERRPKDRKEPKGRTKGRKERKR